jgi:hypothetical protein
LKTNGRKSAKYWLDLEQKEEGGEEYREVTWSESGTETYNCTFHHGKGNENQQLGAEIICAPENNYNTFVATECNVQCYKIKRIPQLKTNVMAPKTVPKVPYEYSVTRFQ